MGWRPNSVHNIACTVRMPEDSAHMLAQNMDYLGLHLGSIHIADNAECKLVVGYYKPRSKPLEVVEYFLDQYFVHFLVSY